MSETCIVCLGDLGPGAELVPALDSTAAKSPAQGQRQDPEPVADHQNDNNDHNDHNDRHDGPDSSLIAHLQPCGHDLHNECLTPWVERANSCPICRRSFHLVQLSRTVGGELKVTLQNSPKEMLLTRCTPRRGYLLLRGSRSRSGGRSRSVHVPGTARRQL